MLLEAQDENGVKVWPQPDCSFGHEIPADDTAPPCWDTLGPKMFPYVTPWEDVPDLL